MNHPPCGLLASHLKGKIIIRDSISEFKLSQVTLCSNDDQELRGAWEEKVPEGRNEAEIVTI